MMNSKTLPLLRSSRIHLFALLLALLPVTAGCDPRGEAHAADREPAASRATEHETSPTDKTVAVRTAVVGVREVVDKALLPADLLPMRRAVLAAEVAGVVEAIHVEEGARVAAGRLLIEVDTRALRQGVAEAEAIHCNRAIAFERAEKLLARRSITELQYHDALTARDVATAQLESANLALEKSRLHAPWGGTVATKRVEVGDYVVPGQPMAELLEVRRLKVRAPAPASDVPYLRPGLPVEIRLDAFPEEVFRGEVARLAAELDSAARTLDVEVEIDNPDGRLRPGMFARLELPRCTLPEAVLVPLEAAVELEGSRVVYVEEDGRAVRRPVTLGSVMGQEVVIAEGLSAGESLIVEGQRRVSPGQRVTVVSSAD